MRSFIDETGNKYGWLSVLEFIGVDHKHNACFLCECTCGNFIEVKGDSLRRGFTRSCGCLHTLKRKEVSIERNHKLNERFGKLIVKSLAGRDRAWALWECQCDCGNTITVPNKYLIQGRKEAKSCGCEFRLKTGESNFNNLFYVYKRNARNRTLSWEISKSEFKTLTKEDCYYCGTIPSSSYHSGRGNNGDYIYNGVDRVDNTKGYVIGNVVPCCSRCNYMKRTYTLEEFKNQIESIYNHWAKKS